MDNFDKEALRNFSIVGGVIVVLLTLLTSWQGYGDGQHSGVITAVESSGTIWQTERLYLKTDATSSQEDAYCIKSNSLYEKAKELQGKRVIIYHASEGFAFPWECGAESAIVRNIVEEENP